MADAEFADDDALSGQGDEPLYDGEGFGETAAEDGMAEEADHGPVRYHWAGAAEDPLAYEAAAGGEDEADLDMDGGEDEADLDMEHELPEFASKEARDLMQEIRRLEERVSVAQKESTLHKERIRVMAEHMKNVTQEVSHTESVLESKSKEVRTEDHLKQLAEREIGRIRQELKELETRGEDIADQAATVQANIHKGAERLDSVQDALKVSLEELRAWAEARRQKEEDNAALEKYTKADDSKIRDLGLALEKLTKQVADKRRELERVATETAAKQIELDKAAEDFHVLHSERQQLVVQVQETVATIHTRDEEIREASIQAAEARALLDQRKQSIREQVRLLEGLEEENAESDRTNAALVRRVGFVRDELRQAQEAMREMEDEAHLSKSELGKAALQLTRRRTEMAGLEAQIEELKQRLDEAVAKEKAVVKARGEAKSAAGKLEKAAEKREVELKEQEARLEHIEREIEVVKQKMFKESERKSTLERQEMDLMAEIRGAVAAGKNLSAKIRQLDTESARQAELVYTAEFQIQAMERKLARIKGEVSDEEKKRLEARIAELTEDLARANDLQSKLEAQIKQLAEDLRKTDRHKADLEEKLSAIHGDLAELRLLTKAGEASLSAAAKEKEAVQVEHDVVKLDVARLRDALSTKTDHVFGLENKHQQLQLSIAERRKEIEVHTRLQRAQAKMAEEERHKIAMDLRKREARVGALRRKYEALCAKMRGGEDGEPRSQAYFVIKAAQQREELQRRGDELNAGVLSAEREVRALMATLAQLKKRNTAYRDSFQKADPKAPEAEQLKSLETILKDTTEAMFRKKRELQECKAAIDDASGRAAELLRQRVGLDEQLSKLRSIAADLQEQRDAQIAAVSDAQGAIEDAVGAIRHVAPPTSVKPTKSLEAEEAEEEAKADWEPLFGDSEAATAGELRVRAAALDYSNNSVLFTLGQLAKEFPQLAAPMRASVGRHGLIIPPRAPKRAAAEAAIHRAELVEAEAAARAREAAPPRPEAPIRTFGTHV
jgi:coiled-coil domain-containing protein 39